MRRFACLLFVLLLVGCRPDLPEPIAEAYATLPTEIDFNEHVRPILTDRCFACHGPDTTTQQAGLRLDGFDWATAALPEHPSLVAIAPGKPAQSELVNRILHTDPNVVMPPPESNLQLTSREVAILYKWIEQGAEYKKHWAFIPPRAPATAATNAATASIDDFVAERLQEEGLEPAAEADKSMLLRRVTLDLTGLPPIPEELRNFLADDSPEAYERVVDRLLASPHYGEHLATDWMDVARYADTHGYTVDRFREMSPWRDWVIKAFNENMRYDSFVVWQLAGDLLPDPTPEQRLATGFNRLHQQNMEGGIVPEEFRVEYVADRVNTFSTAFLGLTTACARCHDHKYDPISQREYYQLFSFFNNVPEAGQISWDNATPVPSMLRLDAETRQAIKALEASVLSAEVEAMDEHDMQAYEKWFAGLQRRPLEPEIKDLIAEYRLEGNLRNRRGGADGEMRRTASNDEKPTFTDDGLLLDGDAWLHCVGTKSFGRADPFSVTIRVKLPAELEDGVVFHQGEGAAIYNFRGYHLALKDNKLEVLMAHTTPYNAIEIVYDQPIPREEWVDLLLTYDGSAKAAGLTLYVNGVMRQGEVVIDNLYKDILFGREQEPPLQVGARWRGKGLQGAVAGAVSVYDRALTPLEAAHLAGDPKLGTYLKGTVRNEHEGADLYRYYRGNHDQAHRQRLLALQRLRRQKTELVEPIPEIMVMAEMDKPRPTFILERGQYDAYGEAVTPGVIQALGELPEDMPRNRLGLAQWLLLPDNPLFARVAVNRYWQRYFGTGLVRTTEDFGSQGEAPSHPRLLDWLALKFRDSGYDVKALQKTIVLSTTYRQDSRMSPALRELDPGNRLLARGPSARLTAEMLRDNALAAADLLNRQIGGPSVKPYQPDGLWRVNGSSYTADTGEKVYRRGLYTFWKRTVPNPSQGTFDAPTRSECTVRRQKTSTPLQALVLLNDPTFTEAARRLGEQMSRTERPDLAISTAFTKVTGREPSVEELALLVEMQEATIVKFRDYPERMDGWLRVGTSPPDTQLDATLVAANSLVASTILNLDATVMKR